MNMGFQGLVFQSLLPTLYFLAVGFTQAREMGLVSEWDEAGHIAATVRSRHNDKSKTKKNNFKEEVVFDLMKRKIKSGKIANEKYNGTKAAPKFIFSEEFLVLCVKST